MLAMNYRGPYRIRADHHKPQPRIEHPEQQETLLQLINYCLRDEMKRDPRSVRRWAHGQTAPPQGVAAVRWFDLGKGLVAVRRQ